MAADYKREATSILLAESLKKLMERIPFEKITIKNITDEAGLIRPTFYNHFADKYALLEWIFRNEIVAPAAALIEGNMLQEAMNLMMMRMEQDRPFYVKAARIQGQNSFGSIVQEVFYDLLNKVFSENIHVHPAGTDTMVTVSNLAKFYANSTTFILMQWITSDMKTPPKEVAHLYSLAVLSSMHEIVKELNNGKNA